MKQQRKTYTPEFKLKVVLESLQRDTTLEAVCQRFGISKSMVQRWRQDFQTNAANALLDKRNPQQKAVAQGYPPGESPSSPDTYFLEAESKAPRCPLSLKW